MKAFNFLDQWFTQNHPNDRGWGSAYTPILSPKKPGRKHMAILVEIGLQSISAPVKANDSISRACRKYFP